MGHVVSLPELTERLAPYRARNATIVSTNGCFDLLHVGHLRSLQAARAMGDVLVVAINSDASVRGLKGPDRPIVCEGDRAELLAGLGCVDYVVIFDAPTPLETLKAIQPNIHIKGAEYSAAELPEAEALKAMGTELRLLPMVQCRSTTGLVERILAVKG